MKEILKYLRQLNSYTQEEVAQKLSVSRQSYSKYEKGTVVPSDKMILKIAELYNVHPDFIRENNIPYKAAYSLSPEKDAMLEFASSSASAVEYDAYFDGNEIKVIGDVHFEIGERFKLIRERIDREKAWNNFVKILKKFHRSLPKDFDAEKAYEEAMEEKYGPFN